MTYLFGLMPVVVLLSFLITWGLRKYAIAHSVIDVPGARSSHTVPTPRGGGVAIVITFLAILPMFTMAGAVTKPLMWAVLGSGAGIALLGFLDDHGHIAARWRLTAHFIAAAWALYWLGGLPPLALFDYPLHLGWVGHALAAMYLVWMLNLYNFMDGIDGIASVEAVCVCIGAVCLYVIAGRPEMIGVPLLLACAVIGFLIWNFPPAKIFMGDAGSSFIGIVIGILSLEAAWMVPHALWAWLIMLGVFIVDATFTLLRRLLRKEKFYEAHRSHAYQFASRRYGKHLPVTLGVAAINLCWLLPIALWVGTGTLRVEAGVILAYAPLIVLAIYYRAGAEEIAE